MDIRFNGIQEASGNVNIPVEEQSGRLILSQRVANWFYIHANYVLPLGGALLAVLIMWGPLGVFDEDVRYVPVPAATHSQQATTQPPTALTVDDVKAGLKAAREIVTEADGLRGQVKAMAQAELPPPTATPPAAKAPESKPEKPDIWDSPKNK